MNERINLEICVHWGPGIQGQGMNLPMGDGGWVNG
jgi:hypothetical protein